MQMYDRQEKFEQIIRLVLRVGERGIGVNGSALPWPHFASHHFTQFTCNRFPSALISCRLTPTATLARASIASLHLHIPSQPFIFSCHVNSVLKSHRLTITSLK
jgi:hypothetical protein